MAKKITVSSRRWLEEHHNDQYVKQAHKLKLRSRAYFKLEEIHKSDRIFKKGMVVIDLGAAPGGWSQYVTDLLQNQGQIIACDILPMDPINGVDFVQGDFRDQEVFDKIITTINHRAIDVVLSDMSPNFSGNPHIDIPRAMYLCELTLEMVDLSLTKGGSLVIKVFQGEGFEQFLQQVKQRFKIVKIRKPDSSRNRSREQYIIGLNYKKDFL